jgi:hypothetical protein
LAVAPVYILRLSLHPETVFHFLMEGMPASSDAEEADSVRC